MFLELLTPTILQISILADYTYGRSPEYITFFPNLEGLPILRTVGLD